MDLGCETDLSGVSPEERAAERTTVVFCQGSGRTLMNQSLVSTSFSKKGREEKQQNDLNGFLLQMFVWIISDQQTLHLHVFMT